MSGTELSVLCSFKYICLIKCPCGDPKGAFLITVVGTPYVHTHILSKSQTQKCRSVNNFRNLQRWIGKGISRRFTCLNVSIVFRHSHVIVTEFCSFLYKKNLDSFSYHLKLFFLFLRRKKINMLNRAEGLSLCLFLFVYTVLILF